MDRPIRPIRENKERLLPRVGGVAAFIPAVVRKIDKRYNKRYKRMIF